MEGSRYALVIYPMAWKKYSVMHIHKSTSVLQFCHYYSLIDAKGTLLSLKYQRANLVIPLYNEVYSC